MQSRSGKTVSLLITTVATMVATAMFASPAMAFSLNPEAGSPAIEKINTLNWIMLFVVVGLVVIVNLAILRATRPRHRHVVADEGQADSGRQWKVGIGLGVVTLAIFVTATIYSDKAREVPTGSSTVAGLTEDDQLEIRVTGQQWLWRYDYPNGAFSFHRLVVPSDTTVALDLVSADVIHGWNVPSLTAKAQAVPGKTNRVYFRADEEGVHSGRASILSGQGYDTMESEVEVVSPAAYESFVERLATEIQNAQDIVEETQAEEIREAEEETPGGTEEPTP